MRDGTTLRGRPRQFDPEQALEQALRLFWEKGYEGTSIGDLSEAMGINRPSLYAAFGDKEALFRKVLDRYVEGPGSHVRKALEEPTARGVAQRLLYEAADLLSDPGNPHGCLLVHGALSCDRSAEPVRRELAQRRSAGEAQLRERFERASAEGDLPAGTDPADLARYLTVVGHGLAVNATGGATRDELRRVVTLALKACPE